MIGRILNKIGRMYFSFLEKRGVHITPANFYSPIPILNELPQDIHSRISECVGIKWQEEVQENYLNHIFPKYVTEVEFYANYGLSLVDAAVLHAMVRHHKPSKMIEIGSGASTKFSARACLMNQEDGHPCAFTAIEPYPNAELQAGIPGLTELVVEKVEFVDREKITDCDILFIDSSHAVRIGGDVVTEILELVPRLKVGALIHWHDILIPGEYWREWIRESGFFWSEQYLLQAFLMFNSDFEIQWASRYMHLNHDLQNTFPFFDKEKHHITSFWIKRVR